MRSGIVSPQPPLVPRTSATESSLWPTPNQPNGGRVIPKRARWSGKAAYLPDGKKLQVGLESAVRMWPTPKGSPDHYGRPRKNDRGDLQASVKIWPTPRAQDSYERSNWKTI